MEKIIFPKKSEWGDAFSTARSGGEYLRLVESCSVAYFHKNPITRGMFRRRLKKALKYFSKNSYDVMLDAGCGIGFLLPSLAAIARKVEGVDHYDQAIYCARELMIHRKISHVSLGVADLGQLPFPDNHFDGIISLSVLEHITDLDQALQELVRVSRPGAEVVLGFPMEGDGSMFSFFEMLDYYTFSWRYSRILRKQPELRSEAPGHVSTWKQIDAAIKRHFSVKEESYLSIIPFIGRLYAFRYVTKL